MKRVSSLFLALALFWGLFSIPVSVRAQDVDYTIEQYQVEVRMDRARRYVVTETIDVRFPSERQGIYRDLPLFGGEEDYNLHDISVEGAQYQLEPGGETLRIRIGTPGEYVTGMQRYVIRYTMDHAADGDSSYDHAYINLLGQGWECSIQSFSAAVQLPERPVRYQVFSGREGKPAIPISWLPITALSSRWRARRHWRPGPPLPSMDIWRRGRLTRRPRCCLP